MRLKKLKLNKRYGSNNLRENMIVKGDNKQVLEILNDTYQNKVKCIYIDPPYNNGENYNYYFDDEDHKKWLVDISATLKLLLTYLQDNGSIWISIDDSELHYLKVEADKIFNRKNFVSTIVWKHRTSRENRNVFSYNHEYILVYAKNIDAFKKSRNKIVSTTSLEILKR